MSDIDFYNGLVAIVGEKNVRTDEPLKLHTTFKIGGPADYFVKPSDSVQTASIINLCRDNEVPWFILGNGSNLLVSDSGYRGVVINIADNMNRISVDGERITAQAGAMLIKVSGTARDNSLTGMEFASGIPGTVGGAVYMNAGAYGGDMSGVVSKVTALTQAGEICEIDGKDMKFAYRHSIIEENDLIVLEVVIELKHGDMYEINCRMKELSDARRSKQPLEYPSAGSTFKRPEGYFAGKLIMDAGLRGYSVGGAQISEKHCGFVVNKGGATASDVVTLIQDVQDRVQNAFGVRLDTEVKTLGDF